MNSFIRKKIPKPEQTVESKQLKDLTILKMIKEEVRMVGYNVRNYIYFLVLVTEQDEYKIPQDTHNRTFKKIKALFDKIPETCGGDEAREMMINFDFNLNNDNE